MTHVVHRADRGFLECVQMTRGGPPNVRQGSANCDARRALMHRKRMHTGAWCDGRMDGTADGSSRGFRVNWPCGRGILLIGELGSTAVLTTTRGLAVLASRAPV